LPASCGYRKMKDNKRTTSKLLIFLIILTLVFTQGSFAFADTEGYVSETDIQTADEEMIVLESADESVAEAAEEPEEVFAEEPAAEEIPEEEILPEEVTTEETAEIPAEPQEVEFVEEMLHTEELSEDTEPAEEVVAETTEPETVFPEEETVAYERSPVVAETTVNSEGTDEITIDEVKAMIEELPNCSDVTEADRERIEAAQAAYEALSTEDQAALDTEIGTYAYNTGQPYGRVLEVALWGLWSYDEVDDSTTLGNGTYNAASTPALTSEYSKGKSTSSRQKPWSVKEVKVQDGHAVATITVESTSYTGIWKGGKTYPRTNTSGNCEFANVPIDLNSTFFFAGISSSMPVPIAFSLTTTIEESSNEPEPEADADYSKVDSALAKVPKDLSIYTDESVKMLNKAIKAVERGLKASEQAKVDAMAKAIEDAIKGLVKKEVLPDGSTALKITNNTGMFKAESAYLLVKDGKESIVITMSGSGYHELYKGTYEQAVANGDGTKENGNNSWVHGKLNSNGKWEFKIPLKSDESYVPCVAISNTYYNKYLSGNNPLERSFYPRQFKLDRKAKTLETDDYNETVEFTVKSNVADFKVNAKASTKVVGGPNSNNYSVSPVLVMQDSTYDEIIYPTVKNGELVEEKTSIKSGKFFISLANAPNMEAFKDKNAIEMKFHVSDAAPYKAAGEYVKRTVTINKLAQTIVINGIPLAEKDSNQQDDIIDPDESLVPEDPDDGSGDEGAGTAPAVDSTTTLKDGVYTPDSFSWSGGSGRLAYIRCNKITVRNGQAYAEIEFSSPNYDALQASGGTYTKQGSGNSVFTIPVNLNANNTIIGRTTAMSQAHWVKYTIYIGLGEASEDGGEKSKEAKQEAAEAKMEISEEAPTIVGLETAEEKEDAEHYSKYFKIFNYENGVKMLSIDISDKTALKEEYTENAKKAAEASESDDDLEYDEEGNVISKSKGEYIEEMYKNNVVNYLLVPEDYEVPAGLDKEYVIITVPCEKSFVASQEVLAMMEELGCTEALSLLGIDEKEIKSKDLKKAVKDEKIKLAGNTEKIEFAKVVKEKSDIAILPGDLLPEEIKKDAKDKEKLEKEAKEKQETLEKYESRFTALDVPVIIDRSAQEEDELAQAEWIKVYGALFGCDEQAKKIFDEKVKEAEKNGKN